MAAAYNFEIMRVFGFWTGILTLKILAMALLTGRYRFQKKVFANPEDAARRKGHVAYDDVDVERVRRCHLNDLENILPWVAITYIYLGTNPSNYIAGLLIRSFVASRMAHTLFYAIYSTPPLRATSWAVGFGITAFQAAATMCYYF